MNAFSKTALYADRADLPPLVARAVALANDLGFIHCCSPEQGVLLQVLARGRSCGARLVTRDREGENARH